MQAPADSRPPGGAWCSAARESATRRPALETLCGAYWSPVYGFVRRQGNDSEAAKDLTQAFFARLLEKDSIAAASAGRGRFRSFLLGCLKNYLANEWDYAHAQKRGGDGPMLPFEFDDTERRPPTGAGRSRHTGTDLRAALGSDGAAARSAGPPHRVRACRPGRHVRAPNPLLMVEHNDSQRTIAARLGMSEGALKMAMLRLRRRYRNLLEAEIAETVRDPAEIDDEIRHLFAALRQP